MGFMTATAANCLGMREGDFQRSVAAHGNSRDRRDADVEGGAEVWDELIDDERLPVEVVAHARAGRGENHRCERAFGPPSIEQRLAIDEALPAASAAHQHDAQWERAGAARTISAYDSVRKMRDDSSDNSMFDGIRDPVRIVAGRRCD